MASSGVKVCDEVLTTYNDMKLRRTNYRAMIMVIDNGKVVQKEMLEKDCGKSQEVQKGEFDKVLGSLPSDGCRFILLDLQCPTSRGSDKECLFLISWCPDTAGVKDKLLYAATKGEVEKKMCEGTKLVQANDLSDIEYDSLVKMADKKV